MAKRTMSTAARKRISEAQKRRWAAYRRKKGRRGSPTVANRRGRRAAAIAGILVLSSAVSIARYLDQIGVVSWANSVREEYVTGTAVTVTLVLLTLSPSPRILSIRRCPVCEARISRAGKYYCACGTRLRS